MKKNIIILFLFISVIAKANTYYVSTAGDDGDAGTLVEPWATFQFAVSNAHAGDTVYFRGGVYTMTSATGIAIYPYAGIGYNGTVENPICYFAYPVDYAAGNIPIFDYSSVPNVSTKKGLRSDSLEYVHFKGFEIRNIEQYNPNGTVTGMGISYPKNVIIENVTLRNIGGAGFVTTQGRNISYINCDAINCADPYSTSSSGPYGAGDGWQTNSNGVNNSSVYLKGCRAIFCSDDGYDSYWNDGTVVYDSCWALGDNHTGGEGNGWKLGRNFYTVSDSLQRKVTHCISVNHHTSGFNDNHIKGHTAIYNNVSYNDSIGYYHLSSGDYNYLVTFRNNIAYDYWTTPIFNFDSQPNVIHDHNSWNGGVTITNDDFISLDTTALYGERQADGSLPLTNFMKLVPTSDLIDTGVNVDLDYYGDAPDLGWIEYTPGPQIIADHTIVDDYENIPQYYIDRIMEMRVSYPGESHARWIEYGMPSLETADAAYQVNITATGSPEGATSDYLRMDYFMWGNVIDADSWYISYGEEDWWTSATAITRTKASLQYCHNNGYTQNAVGFGWCWDEITQSENISIIDPINGAYWGGFLKIGSVTDYTTIWGLDDADNVLTGNTLNMDDYLDATQQYIEYCKANNLPTKVFFTTPPTNGGWVQGSQYQAALKAQHIRDYVLKDNTRILFDYADILAYDDNGNLYTETWNGHTYPQETPTNVGDESEAHIDSPGTLRLAKAMWWMLARMAGWDGGITVYGEDEPSDATDIITFTLPEQTGSATINATLHTVSIEVEWDAVITSLTPTITVSGGATIDPTSGTARNFTNPITYTVTAEDTVTEQEWTVTVTKEAEPSSAIKLLKKGIRLLKKGTKFLK